MKPVVLFGKYVPQSFFLMKNLSLNPKSYYATDGTIVKSAAKGVQKKSDLTYEKFKKVLYGHNETVTVKNKMFRVARGQMSTVSVTKTGLSNVFTKTF